VNIIRGHVRGVCFQEETFERCGFYDFGGVLVGRVGYHAGDTNVGVGKVGEDGGGERGRVGEAVDMEVC